MMHMHPNMLADAEINRHTVQPIAGSLQVEDYSYDLVVITECLQSTNSGGDRKSVV